MAYTEEQIQKVCNAGYETMGRFTEVQNCTFPSSVIREGMEKGLDAKEIACNAYNAIITIPVRQNQVAECGPSMHNIAMFMQNEIEKRINALGTP